MIAFEERPRHSKKSAVRLAGLAVLQVAQKAIVGFKFQFL